MSTQQQALEMLAQGISPVQVATAIGVTESYISQLMGDEDFRAALESHRIARSKEDLAFDAQLERTEKTYLERIEEKAKFANLQQSLQAFKIVNSARRRKDSAIIAGNTINNVAVVIQLPQTAAAQYVVSSQNEIIEVDGKTMVSATPRKLDEILAARKGITSDQLKPQLPGVTKVERAAAAIEELDNKPVRRLTKAVRPEDLVDLL